jgi:hypothetical protein
MNGPFNFSCRASPTKAEFFAEITGRQPGQVYKAIAPAKNGGRYSYLLNHLYNK